ncbi:MAG: gamma-glutamyltranspeptidase / glutathione hydrolase [Actinomycetota bacterium]|nr:gamma-glutamyltranspeptidase / glutathione hydrolase [Actinomycetota bacterium]
MTLPRRPLLAAATALVVPAALLTGPSVTGVAGAAERAPAAHRATAKQATAVGRGGAVSTVDPEATRAGLRVLRHGGNAVDAAVAAAATLGVTEPYSTGIGGGGYFVFYDAKAHRVRTIDGRETAPMSTTADTYRGLSFDEAVNSGLSVGVPGTARTWSRALHRWGTLDLAEALAPATAVARRGFVVDQTFRDQTASNEARFRDIVPTRELFLPGGQLPVVGSVFRNPALADTYDRLGRKGVDWLYGGRLGREIVHTVQVPPKDPAATRNVRPGLMTAADLARYRAVRRAPTHVGYRGLGVWGMAPSSSGGSTVGEALNILENVDLGAVYRADHTKALHDYLEASALAFADRGKYVGAPSSMQPGVLGQLTSQGFADERFCSLDQTKAATKPVPAGTPDGSYDTNCDGVPDQSAAVADHEGLSTSHLTTADRWGNVVTYTLTIEQTGGSALTVPGRGFLLNNELTDFDLAPASPTAPNAPGGGKRPRSSMSPTIVTDHGRPVLATGSPGGSTIITTVLQVLIDRLDFGMSLPQAVAAPRASQRNTADVQAEPAFDRAGLSAYGHTFVDPPAPGEIGAVTGIEFRSGGRMVAVAEPVRRGGGDARVVHPR